MAHIQWNSGYGDRDENGWVWKKLRKRLMYWLSQHEAGTGAEDGAMHCLLEERSSSDSSRRSSSSSEF